MQICCILHSPLVLQVKPWQTSGPGCSGPLAPLDPHPISASPLLCTFQQALTSETYPLCLCTLFPLSDLPANSLTPGLDSSSTLHPCSLNPSQGTAVRYLLLTLVLPVGPLRARAMFYSLLPQAQPRRWCRHSINSVESNICFKKQTSNFKCPLLVSCFRKRNFSRNTPEAEGVTWEARTRLRTTESQKRGAMGTRPPADQCTLLLNHSNPAGFLCRPPHPALQIHGPVLFSASCSDGK